MFSVHLQYTILITPLVFSRRVWRYQRGNQSPYIEEAQTTQWTNNDLQNIHTQLKIKWHEPLWKPGLTQVLRKVSSSCSTSGARRVNLVTNPMISHEWGKDREVFSTNGTYSITMNQVMVATVKFPKDDFNLAKRNPRFSSILVSSKPQGNPNRNHKLWNIVLTERDILHMQVLLECCYI